MKFRDLETEFGPERCSTYYMQSRRILLVDDNMDQVQTMAFLLRDMGHTVRIAVNGASALREARGFIPEIMFVDLALPDMDGRFLCRQLCNDPAFHSTRFFAITGSVRQADWDDIIAAGFERLLLKPVDPKFLESLLRR